MPYPFYAMLSRMKYINRWGLMRNTHSENIQEHSQQVAVIAHALALIRNRYFDGCVDANKAAVMALFHDCDEILTGDLPTPVKYFNEGILNAYRNVEDAASEKLLQMLPDELRPDYRMLIGGGAGAGNDESRGETPDAGENGPRWPGAEARPCEGDNDANLWKLVKAADTICAHIKCLEETAGGNSEFTTAARSTRAKLDAIGLPEVDKFIELFLESFKLPLDDYGI